MRGSRWRERQELDMKAFAIVFLLTCLPWVLADAQSTPLTRTIRGFHVTPFEFNGDVRSLPGPAQKPSDLHPGELRAMDDGVGEEEPTLPDELHRPAASFRPGASPAELGPLVPTPAPLASFEGMANADFGANVVPPDPAGAVGANHYVQFLNSANGGTVGIYVKSTGVRASQFFYRTLFSSLPTGTVCDGTGHSDPQIVYDSANDRFILMDITTAPPFEFCIAVSKTGDPVTGGFFLYVLPANQGNATLPDYEKMGIWPD